MNEILTAKEYLKEWLNNYFNKNPNIKHCTENDGVLILFLFFDPLPAVSIISLAMSDYTKLHVEATLKAVNENIELIHSETQGVSIDKDSILNAYPLTNIK